MTDLNTGPLIGTVNNSFQIAENVSQGVEDESDTVGQLIAIDWIIGITVGLFLLFVGGVVMLRGKGKKMFGR